MNIQPGEYVCHILDQWAGHVVVDGIGVTVFVPILKVLVVLKGLGELEYREDEI